MNDLNTVRGAYAYLVSRLGIADEELNVFAELRERPTLFSPQLLLYPLQVDWLLDSLVVVGMGPVTDVQLPARANVSYAYLLDGPFMNESLNIRPSSSRADRIASNNFWHLSS